MLISNVAVETLSFGNARLTWSGTAGKTVRVFLNGLLSFGPRALSDADKSLVLSLPDPVIVEVHENVATETVTPIGVALQRKPVVWWTARPGAIEYVIYWIDQIIGVVRHTATPLHYEFQIPVDLRQDGGVWTQLRVEARTAKGRESVRAAFNVYAPGLPAQPSFRMFVSGGVFTFAWPRPLLNEFGQPVLNRSGQAVQGI